MTSVYGQTMIFSLRDFLPPIRKWISEAKLLNSSLLDQEEDHVLGLNRPQDGVLYLRQFLAQF